MQLAPNPRVLLWTLIMLVSMSAFSLLLAPALSLTEQATVYARNQGQPTTVTGFTTLSYEENPLNFRTQIDTVQSSGTGTIQWSVTGTDIEDFVNEGGELSFNEFTRSHGTFASGGDKSPQISGPFHVEYPENGTGPVASYAAGGPEEGAVTWSLFGRDSKTFEISDDGILSFRNPPDFEAPTGFEGNIYRVNIRAEDDANPQLSAQLDVAVGVANVNEAPIVGDIPNADLMLGQQSWMFELDESFTDPDGDSLAYRISGDSITPVATAALEDGVLWITPAAEGSVSFHIVAVDPVGISALGMLRVLVTDPTPEPASAPAAVFTSFPAEVEVHEGPVASDLSTEPHEFDAYWPLSERRWANFTQQPEGISKVLVAFAIEPVDELSNETVELPPYATPPVHQGRTMPMEATRADPVQAPIAPAPEMEEGELRLWVFALLMLLAVSTAGYAVRMLVIHRL